MNVSAAMRLHFCICERIAGLAVATASPDSQPAEEALQPLLSYDSAVSASVREIMLECMEFDPLLHGLLHAVAAAAHCDGSCTHDKVAEMVLAVQPGVDRDRSRCL